MFKLFTIKIVSGQKLCIDSAPSWLPKAMQIASWRLPDASGAVLEAFWVMFSRPGSNLNNLGDVLSRLGNVLSLAKGILEPSWNILEASWQRLGRVLSHEEWTLDLTEAEE